MMKVVITGDSGSGNGSGVTEYHEWRRREDLEWSRAFIKVIHDVYRFHTHTCLIMSY